MNMRTQVSLASYTTFGIGGPAEHFVEVATERELEEAVRFSVERSLPVFVMGMGSNLLVSDRGFPGVVIRMTGDRMETIDEGPSVLVIAEAGKSWDDLVALCVERGWWGMENLSGIPSSVGASAVQNIGAYGTEVSTLVEWVEVYDRTTHTTARLPRSACLFGYRDSIFKQEEGKGLIVMKVAYRLRATGSPVLGYKDLEEYHQTIRPIVSLSDMRSAVLAVRSGKFPKHGEAGTAGSFFKNPVVSREIARDVQARFPEAPVFPQIDGSSKLSAAWIIDHVLHLRGVREGDVGTWPTQALIVVNYGHAQAQEVLRFIERIRTECRLALGVELTPEVVFVGDDLHHA